MSEQKSCFNCDVQMECYRDCGSPNWKQWKPRKDQPKAEEMPLAGENPYDETAIRGVGNIHAECSLAAHKAFDEGQVRQQSADLAYHNEKIAIIKELWKRDTKKVLELQEALRDEAEKYLKLLNIADAILEFAEHGDYSNGNLDSTGVTDEGDVMASRFIIDYRKQLADLRKQAGE